MDTKVQLGRLAVLAAIIALWEVAPLYHIVNPYVVSPLFKILASYPELNQKSNFLVPAVSVFGKTLYGIFPNVYITLYEVAVAFALSVVIGLGIGFSIGYYKMIADIYEPFVYLAIAIPPIVLYPIFYLTLGLSYDSKIAFAVILGSFPLIINAAAGLRQVPHNYIRLAKSLGATDRQIIARVLLPAGAPNIMSGVRLSLGGVVIGVIAGEIIESTVGLGRIINNAASLLRTDEMYAGIILVILLAFGLYMLTIEIERIVLPFERKRKVSPFESE